MLRSPRLDLLELTAQTLARIADGDRAGVEADLGARASDEWLRVVPARVNHKLLREKPDAGPWLSRAVVLREERRLVGEVGFHNPPDGLAVVEIGYEVLPGYRRRGVAREAIRALTDWAYSTGRARVVFATIARDNLPSIELVRSLGFTFDEACVDPVEGPLEFYEGKLPLPR